MQFIHQPAANARLGEFLQSNLQRAWTSFRAAVAFVKRSGTKHITPHLAEFSRNNQVEIIAGIDLNGTSQEGLQQLLDAVEPNGRIIVFHNRLTFTFHPKVYVFKSASKAEILIGSGNLTEGGLFTNYEASVRLQLDLAKASDQEFLQSVEDVLDSWADLSSGTALLLDAELLTKLVAHGYVPIEALTVRETAEERIKASGAAVGVGEETGIDEDRETVEGSLFASRIEPRAPPSLKILSGGTSTNTLAGPSPVICASPKGFLMTLQRTDVGLGQTTQGTARRSPEIFIPLSARDAAPEFWGWDSAFTEDNRRPGKFDRQGVLMRVGAELVSVNMMTWPVRYDFRLRSEALRSAGAIGDILRIEKVNPSQGYEYYVEIVPQGTTQFATYEVICSHLVHNSNKRYGYY